MKESEIQRQCLVALSKVKNIYYFRAGSGAIKTQYGGYFKTGKKGCPDVVGCYKGYFVGWELKTDKGKQSDEQEATEKLIKSIYGFYFVIRSVEDLMESFKKIDSELESRKIWMI